MVNLYGVLVRQYICCGSSWLPIELGQLDWGLNTGAEYGG